MTERRKYFTTHGHTSHGYESPTYRSWKAMKRRCNSKDPRTTAIYGAVSFCERWASFEVFLEDMGERPEGTSLDRIDGAKGYSKANCRWANRDVQNRNRASCCINEEKAREIYQMAHSGISHTKIAELVKCAPSTVSNIKNGHSWSSVTGHNRSNA